MKIFRMFVAQPTLEAAVEYIEGGMPITGGMTRPLGVMDDQAVELLEGTVEIRGPRGGRGPIVQAYTENGELGDVIIHATATATDPDGFVWEIFLCEWVDTGVMVWVIVHYAGFGVQIGPGTYTLQPDWTVHLPVEPPEEPVIFVPSYSNCRWDWSYSGGDWSWVCDVTSVPIGTETPMPEPTTPKPIGPPI